MATKFRVYDGESIVFYATDTAQNAELRLNTSDQLELINANGGLKANDLTLTGSVLSGIWAGSTIAANKGGTGFSSFAAGDLLYADSTSTLAKLTKGAVGNILTINSGGNLAWSNTISANGITVTGDVTITGNLVVAGTQTTINTATLMVSDNIITLNQDVTGTPSENAGIEIERGTSTNASILWDETSDKWKIGIAGSEIEVVDLSSTQALLNKTYNALALTSAATGFTIAGGTTSKTLTVDATLTASTGLSLTGTSNRISVSGSTTLSAGGSIGTIDISSAYVGQTSITTLGTVTSGTWNATTIAVTKGGTGLTTLAAGSLMYGNGTSTFNTLAIGTNNYVLQSNGSAPEWRSALTIPGNVSSANVTVTGNIGLSTFASGFDGYGYRFSKVAYGGSATSSISGVSNDTTAKEVTITTSAAHGILVSQAITIAGAVGMTDLNTKSPFKVLKVPSTTTLVIGLNTAQTWTSGGTITPVAYTSLGEVDNLVVRGTMQVYELLIQQVRATNGSLFVTASATVDSITIATIGSEVVVFEDPAGRGLTPFAVGDILLCKRVSIAGSTIAKQIVRQVSAISGSSVTFTTTAGAPTDTSIVEKGDVFVRIGNVSDANRRGSIYLTSDDSNAPYININAGVAAYADWTNATAAGAKLKVRLGRLDGITDTAIGLSGSQSNLYGLYSDSAYLKGNLVVGGGQAITHVASTIALGNITGTAASSIKISNTGTANTSGIFGYNSGGTEVFKLALDSTAQIAGWSFDATTLSSGGSSGIKLVSNATAANNKIYIGTGTFNNSNTPFYIDGSGNFSISDKLSWNGTTLSVNGSGTFTGAVTATSGTFTGTVNASAGNFTGTVTIGTATNKITLAATATDTTTAIYSKTGTFGNAANGFWLDASGRFGLGDKLTWNGTALTLNGTLTAGSGSVIGSWNVTTGIYSGKTAFNDATAGIWLGTNGIALGTGPTAPFSVTSAGLAYMISGTIGGWTLASSGLSSGNITLDASTGYIKVGTLTSIDPNTANIGFYATTAGSILIKTGTTANANYIKFDSGVVDINSTSFKLMGSTTLYLDTTKIALGASASSISLSAGIGVFANTSGHFKAGSTTKYIKWDGTDFTWAGANNSLTATTFTTTNASIGGWTIDSTTIASTGINLTHNATAASANIRLGSASALGTGAGVWMDGSGNFRVGDPSGNYAQWSSSTLTVKGTINATAGYFGSTSNAIDSEGLKISDGTYYRVFVTNLSAWRTPVVGSETIANPTFEGGVANWTGGVQTGAGEGATGTFGIQTTTSGTSIYTEVASTTANTYYQLTFNARQKNYYGIVNVKISKWNGTDYTTIPPVITSIGLSGSYNNYSISFFNVNANKVKIEFIPVYASAAYPFQLDDVSFKEHRFFSELNAQGLYVYVTPSNYIKLGKDAIDIKTESMLLNKLTVTSDLTVNGNFTVNGNQTITGSTTIATPIQVLNAGATLPTNGFCGIEIDNAVAETGTGPVFMYSVADSRWQIGARSAGNNGAQTSFTSMANVVTVSSTDTLTNKTWQGAVISSTYGGTGVNNGGRTITVSAGNVTFANTFTTSSTVSITGAMSVGGALTTAGAFTISGANALTFTTTNTTSLTLPAVTDTVAVLGTAQTFSAAKTFTGGIVANSNITGTGTYQAAAITDTYLATITTAGKVNGTAITSGNISTSGSINTTNASGFTKSGVKYVKIYRESIIVGAGGIAQSAVITVPNSRTYTATAVDSDNKMFVYVDGRLQKPGASYDYVEASTTTITFNYDIAEGASIEFIIHAF